MHKNMDVVTLEEEYSPSSCVDDINIYINQYIEQSHKVKSAALEERSVLMDLQYGTDEDQVLDLFLPITSEKNRHNAKKLHIYIHGGYWQELTKNESAFAARNFQQHGCFFAVINYSLAPKVNLTEIVEQNRRAIAWLVSVADEYGFDYNEIYLSGSSAGGHLCLMMLQTQWQDYIVLSQYNFSNKMFIKGVCAVSGVYDIAPIKKTSVNKLLQLTEKEIQDFSPQHNKMIEQCPVIIAYGDNETSEFKRQSNELIDKLKSLSIEVIKGEIAGRNHFDVILDLAQPNSWLCQQVFKQMKIIVDN